MQRFMGFDEQIGKVSTKTKHNNSKTTQRLVRYLRISPSQNKFTNTNILNNTSMITHNLWEHSLKVKIEPLMSISLKCTEIRARLEFKFNTQTLISLRSKGMKYFNEPIIVSMKMKMFKGNKIQTIDTSI